MTGLTPALAGFIAGAAGSAADPGRDAAATAAVLDSVAVVGAGLTSDAGTAVLRWVAGVGAGTRPVPGNVAGAAGGGHATRTRQHPDGGTPARAGDLRWTGAPQDCPPEVAAMVSATMGHALDFDDVLPGAGHPSNILLAAILALPVAPLSGRRLLDAFLIGYEVNARVSRALGHRHYQHGWHTTATAGVFGATGAAAVVLRLDAAATGMALGIAGSLTGGLQRNFGTMTKPLHSGLAARNGVLAAQLAAAGFTAAPDILDGERGFIDVSSDGAARWDALDGLGEHWAITEPGPTLKRYPAAMEVYRAVDGALAAARELAVAPDGVAAIRCLVPPGTTGPLRYDRPASGLQGKFSMPYAVAAAVLDGRLTLHSFTDAAVRRDAAVRLMDRVVVHEDARCRPEDPSGRDSSASSGGFVEVTVETTGGRSATVRVADVPGSPRRPITPRQQREKFRECLAAGGRDLATVDRVHERLTRLAGAADVHAVLRPLAPSDPGSRRD